MYGKELRREIRARAAGSFPGILRVLPEAWGRGLCAGIGLLAYWMVARDRRLARANLARVYPDWPAARRERTARAVFVEIGRNAYDFLRYPDLDPDLRRSLVAVEGCEHLDRLRQSGRGAVLVTAHLGSWEILAAALAGRGYPLRALARPLREARLEDRLRRHRARMGVETISSADLPLAALRHLRRGGFLGVLMDQRVKGGGLPVAFLGQETRMTDAPARLASAAGVPLVPLGIARGSGNRHRARILDPVDTGPGTPVPALTQELADRLGALIRETPEQWMWIHPRWPDARGDRGHVPREEGAACAAP